MISSKTPITAADQARSVVTASHHREGWQWRFLFSGVDMHNGPAAKQSQNTRVMQHLRNRGSLTTLMAFKRYSITRLAARIDDLERNGHLINSVWVQRNGKRYKAYSLVA